MFFIWGACCFFCSIFVYFCIFETKGLTLEQVDELYERVDHAWQSAGFVPSVKFEEQVRKGADSSEVVHAEDVKKYGVGVSEVKAV